MTDTAVIAALNKRLGKAPKPPPNPFASSDASELLGGRRKGWIVTPVEPSDRLANATKLDTATRPRARGSIEAKSASNRGCEVSDRLP